MKKQNELLVVFISLLLLVGVTSLLGGCEKKTSEPRTAEVKIGENTWVVELAMTQQSRYTGLSGRRELPDNRGMLFIYPRAIPLKFCMRGCLIPIDIVFIGADLRVVNTYAMQVEPNRRGIATASYSSGVAVSYALELPGGTVKRGGIKNGDLVEFVDVPDRGRAEPVD